MEGLRFSMYLYVGATSHYLRRNKLSIYSQPKPQNHMNRLKVLFALLLLTCAAGAVAQDVIVKKDGSTVVCRIVEVSATEIVYKKWTDLQGSNYVMNRTDASVINYENGTRSEMNGTTETPMTPSATTPPTSRFSQANTSRLSADLQLIAMDNIANNSLKKAKIWQRVGWIGGGCLLAVGVPFVIMGIANGAFDNSDDGDNGWVSAYSQWMTGTVMVGSGLAIGTTCVVVGKKMEKRIQNELQYSTLWQEEIPLKNGTSLMAGVDMLKDNRTNTLGIGIRYNF